MRLFDHNTRDKSRMWEVEAEMGNKRLSPKVGSYLNSAESPSPSKSVLGKIAVRDDPQKQSGNKSSSF